jgi:Leucine-rich repeat (LRR) protein
VAAKLGFFSKLNMVLDEKMNQTVFLVKSIYNNNLEWLDLSGTQISKLSFLKHLYNLDTLVLDSCQSWKIGTIYS